jgi:predicted nuclease with RNAse H fold
MTTQCFVGFDPGGQNAFGWAVLEERDGTFGPLRSGTCSDAQSAFETARANVSVPPVAVGIDSPLFWVATGERKADLEVRAALSKARKPTSTVIHVNSLRGACLVQGALVANLVMENWPNAGVTEAHPKALAYLWPEIRSVIERLQGMSGSEHEMDAASAAYAAYMYSIASPGWRDLALGDKPVFPKFRTPVAYWFPRCDLTPDFRTTRR